MTFSLNQGGGVVMIVIFSLPSNVVPIIALYTLRLKMYIQVVNSGRVDDLSFFDYSSPFCFLLIELD